MANSGKFLPSDFHSSKGGFDRSSEVVFLVMSDLVLVKVRMLFLVEYHI
jgi:hypothetical protein